MWLPFTKVYRGTNLDYLYLKKIKKEEANETKKVFCFANRAIGSRNAFC